MELTPQENDVVRCMKRAVYKTLYVLCKYTVSQEPVVEKKDIIQWMQRYNVLKPVDFLYASVITFRYGQQKDLYHVEGIMVIDYPEDVADLIFSHMRVKQDNVDDALDACGEFCNIVAGAFLTELGEAGYEGLDMRIPVTFYGDVDELFEYRGEKQLEISYKHENDNFLKVDIAVDPKALVKAVPVKGEEK